MTFLVTLPLFLLLGAIAGGRWRRFRRDDRSIETHRSTLDVIEHVSGGETKPPPSVHVRILPTPDQPPTSPPPAGDDVDLDQVVLPSLPPQIRRADRAHFPAEARRPLAPVEEPLPPVPTVEREPTMSRDVARLIAGRAARPGPTPQAAPAAPPQRARLGPRQPVRMRRRPDRSPMAALRIRSPLAPTRTPLAALRIRAGRSHLAPTRLLVAGGVLVGALIVAAAIGLALGGGGHPASPHRPPLVAIGHASGASQSPPTTAAPIPAPPAVVATSATATDATYTVTAAELQVDVSTSGACWVEMRNGSASGPVVYEGTLTSGVSRMFQAAGSLWLRLGDPARVKVSIDGSPVNVPAASEPFDLTVVGPAGA